MAVSEPAWTGQSGSGTFPAMLDRPEPLFFAPFVASVMTVEPAWIDYNGHLNMA